MEIEGGNPDAVMRYSIMARELQSLHKIAQRHNKIVNKFKENDTFEWEGLTMLYRAELTPAFFEHLEALIWSRDQSKKKEDLEEKETYVQMFLKIKSFLQSYDQVSEDQAKMDNAAAQFDDLLKGVGTIQDADARIDELAKSGRLDAPMLLTMAKAYSGVKESPYTKDEVKDVMFHLYMKAKEAAAQQQPSDIRILKHILSIDDPKYRFEALEEAFKAPTAVPSSLSNMDRDTSMDYLFTTPDNLLSVVEMVLKVYEDSKGRSSLLGQTADVMSTDVIKRLQETRDYIKKYYM